MGIVDLYQNGYDMGFDDGSSMRRRSAAWELPFRAPVILLPGFDRKTFEKGYYHGYSVGTSAAHIKQKRK